MPFFEQFREQIETKMDHHHRRNWYVNCTTTKFDKDTHAADLHCDLVEAKKKEDKQERKDDHTVVKTDLLNKDKEGRRLKFMSKLKNYRMRGGCPFVVTVIIDHKCYGLYKRHSRRWW